MVGSRILILLSRFRETSSRLSNDQLTEFFVKMDSSQVFDGDVQSRGGRRHQHRHRRRHRRRRRRQRLQVQKIFRSKDYSSKKFVALFCSSAVFHGSVLFDRSRLSR